MRYVALLRGVNLGPNKRVAMSDLRDLLSSLGHTDVRTYLQSGNAVFTSDRDDPEELAREIERGLAREVGHEVAVLIRTGKQLAKVVDGNPFSDVATDPSRLHVSFLLGEPDLKLLRAVDPSEYEPDRFAVGDGVIYLWYPNGMQGTTMNDRFWRGLKLGVQTTTRNWNTVTKLRSMASG